MPCKCISKLDLNVLSICNEGPQRLIINALMIKVLNEARNANGKILQIDSVKMKLKLGLFQEYIMYKKHD